MQVQATSVVVPVIETAIEAALAALGIGVAGSVPKNVYKNFIGGVKTNAVVTAASAVTVATIAGHKVYNMTSDFLHAVGASFLSWYAMAQATLNLGSITVPLSQSGLNVKWSDFYKTLGFTFPIYSESSFNNVESYSILSYVPRYASSSKYSTVTAADITQYWKIKGTNENSTYFKVSSTPTFDDYNTVGFCSTSLTSLGYVMAIHEVGKSSIRYILISNPPHEGSYYYPSCIVIGGSNTAEIPTAPGEDVINLANKIFAQGASIINQSVDDVVGRVGDAVGVLGDDGTISYPLNIPDGAETDVDKARDIDQPTVLGKDIATEDDKAKNEDTNKDKDTSSPKPATLPDLTLPEVIFKEKFPFCLPWDLYAAFSNLVAPAQPPKWEVPFKIASINYQQNIEIDFSQFGTLASILRWGLSIAFVIWLILLTRKIIGQ